MMSSGMYPASLGLRVRERLLWVKRLFVPLLGRSNALCLVACVMRHPSATLLEALDSEQNVAFNVRFSTPLVSSFFCFLIWMTCRITA